jgi:hypothetical protein
MADDAHERTTYTRRVQSLLELGQLQSCPGDVRSFKVLLRLGVAVPSSLITVYFYVPRQ